MKFKNNTTENIKYRIGDYSTGFEWYTIRPGEIKDIPIQSANNLPLTEVKSNEEDTTIDDSKDVDSGSEEEKQEEKTEFYINKINSLKGVGKKTAKDIIKKYPTEDSLKKAIADGKKIHKHNGVDKIVKQEYA